MRNRSISMCSIKGLGDQLQHFEILPLKLSLVSPRCDETSTQTKDESVLVNFDPSIFGADAATYDTIEKDVRREYKFVS